MLTIFKTEIEVYYHEIEKSIASALAAAMLVCAMAVPAFAAEEVEH